MHLLRDGQPGPQAEPWPEGPTEDGAAPTCLVHPPAAPPRRLCLPPPIFCLHCEQRCSQNGQKFMSILPHLHFSVSSVGGSFSTPNLSYCFIVWQTAVLEGTVKLVLSVKFDYYQSWHHALWPDIIKYTAAHNTTLNAYFYKLGLLRSTVMTQLQCLSHYAFV